MSEQITSLACFRICVACSDPAPAKAILAQFPALGITVPVDMEIFHLYFLQGDLSPDDLHRLASLVCDPVTERSSWSQLPEDRVTSFKQPETAQVGEKETAVEVAFLPGVTDTTGQELLQAGRRMGISGLQAVATARRYVFSGSIETPDLHLIAPAFLANETIQRYTIGELQPEFYHPAANVPAPEILGLAQLDAPGLAALGRDRRLALNLDELLAIQDYFCLAGRNPTDAELETLAQTWSEHCIHKTFKAWITVESAETAGDGQPQTIDGLLNTYIQSASRQIDAPWVRSAFVDNAGVIEFDADWDLSFKVETHNHPSAIEPFGGANTGIGGVVRDILGVSHRPVAATDVLCFGPPNLPYAELHPGQLHPARIRAGVVAGVADYGNKLGLPTVNGAVLYHPGYTANPLVFCGCVGLGPRGAQVRRPRPGDRVIVIGGRTGRDGLRGATFSSLAMDAQTGQVAGSSVQIGDPITEKGVIEVVVRAREAGLYNAITDCGAGGLSSAVGEMGAGLGVQVDLAQAPLKYAGLAPWEIWLSEAQERMVLAVPPDRLPALAGLCNTYWVEWSDIGEFRPSGRLQVKYGEQLVVDLDNDFLHHGLPRLRLPALIPTPAPSRVEASELPVTAAEVDGRTDQAARFQALLVQLLRHPNLASKESILRVYDHEVRGATVGKPLAGLEWDGPADAAVLKPLETSGWRGFVLANGINPSIGEADPYAMALSVVDEAVRNAVAVGGDPDRLALLDNFCWGDPRRPETLGSLVRAAQGCYAAAVHLQTPFISGKDSLNNEWTGADGQRHAIPGTLLISSLAIHPDIRRMVTMDLKAPGDILYLAGGWQPALAGSHALQIAGDAFFAGAAALHRAPDLPEAAPQVYRGLHAAILAGWVRAAHDLSEGGLSVAAAEMCLAGRLGLQLDLTAIDPDPRLALFAETNGCLLVEVPPEQDAAFEASFQGLPLHRLGRVVETPVLEIGHAGSLVSRVEVSDLVSAFKFVT